MSNNDDNLNRRRFLMTSAASLAGAGLATMSPLRVLAQEQNTEAEKPTSGKTMTRKLGKTGMELPIISFGAGACNDPGLIQAAYDLGIRHFDSAANYQFGANEQMVGTVIAKMGVRDKVNIGTKSFTGPQRREMSTPQLKKHLEMLCDGSLRRLRTDYLDIFYIHSITTAEEAANPAWQEAMAYLKDKDKIRATGVSTHQGMTEILNQVADDGFYDVVLTGINFTQADDVDFLRAIDKAAKAGVGLIAMKTMAGGGNWANPETRRTYDANTIARACLKWVLNHEGITTAIPGFNNYEHMELDWAVASSLTYSEKESSFLGDNAIKLGMGFCRQCRKCLATCPHGVDVPAMMRTHMYAAQYGNFHLARQAMEEVSSSQTVRACVSCDTCSAACANSVDIARRIDELKLIYT